MRQKKEKPKFGGKGSSEVFLSNRPINTNTEYNILSDISSSGKENDWKKYKNNSIYISNSMFRTGLFERARRLKYCGTHLTFAETFSENKKLIDADFCRDRLCPVCTWRRSLKLFGQTSKLMNFIQDNISVRYIFLTLTVKNCSGSDLSSTIDELVKGFSRLMRRSELKKSILGACRHIEVTYNSNPYSKSFKSFHPHLHIVFAVKPSYFHKGYISQKKWSELWQQSVKADYEPMVHIETVNKSEQEKAVAELSKYPVKMDNLLSVSNSEILDFGVYNIAVGLVNKRLIEYYGIFRKYRQMLKLEDIESADLINTDLENDDEELTGVIFKYQWRCGIFIEVPEFTPVDF